MQHRWLSSAEPRPAVSSAAALACMATTVATGLAWVAGPFGGEGESAVSGKRNPGEDEACARLGLMPPSEAVHTSVVRLPALLCGDEIERKAKEVGCPSITGEVVAEPIGPVVGTRELVAFNHAIVHGNAGVEEAGALHLVRVDVALHRTLRC